MQLGDMHTSVILQALRSISKNPFDKVKKKLTHLKKCESLEISLAMILCLGSSDAPVSIVLYVRYFRLHDHMER